MGGGLMTSIEANTAVRQTMRRRGTDTTPHRPTPTPIHPHNCPPPHRHTPHRLSPHLPYPHTCPPSPHRSATSLKVRRLTSCRLGSVTERGDVSTLRSIRRASACVTPSYRATSSVELMKITTARPGKTGFANSHSSRYSGHGRHHFSVVLGATRTGSRTTAVVRVEWGDPNPGQGTPFGSVDSGRVQWLP